MDPLALLGSCIDQSIGWEWVMLSRIQRLEPWPWSITLGESLSLPGFGFLVYKMRVLKSTISGLPSNMNLSKS